MVQLPLIPLDVTTPDPLTAVEPEIETVPDCDEAPPDATLIELAPPEPLMTTGPVDACPPTEPEALPEPLRAPPGGNGGGTDPDPPEHVVAVARFEELDPPVMTSS
jgi:hypothetical protein